MARRDHIELGTVPWGESCVQVQSGVDYLPAMRAECRRFIELLRRVHGPEPEGARLRIQSNPHDFGTYLDVVCDFDDDFPESVEYALKLEGNVPETWGVSCARGVSSMSTTITPRQARKLVEQWLEEHDLSEASVDKARTVDFTDLARARRVFVTVGNWKPSPQASDLEQFARQHGFSVEFQGWRGAV